LRQRPDILEGLAGWQADPCHPGDADIHLQHHLGADGEASFREATGHDLARSLLLFRLIVADGVDEHVRVDESREISAHEARLWRRADRQDEPRDGPGEAGYAPAPRCAGSPR